MKILGIAGSLREGSYNSKLLRAATELTPSDEVEIEIYDELAQVPPFNGDVDTDDPPAAVASLQGQIERADGLLIATPEYNYGIPGVLKNAIDWASRPTGGQRRLDGKAIAIMGASPTHFGTVRAQLELRQSFVWTNSRVVVQPEVMMMHAQERFDDQGRLTDETSRQLVRDLIGALAELVAASAPVGTA